MFLGIDSTDWSSTDKFHLTTDKRDPLQSAHCSMARSFGSNKNYNILITPSLNLFTLSARPSHDANDSLQHDQAILHQRQGSDRAYTTGVSIGTRKDPSLEFL